MKQLQASEAGEFDKFVHDILPLFRQYIAENSDPNISLFNLIEKDMLLEKFHNFGGDLPENPISFNKLKKEIELILKYTVRTSKNKFLGKFYCGTDSISQFATLLLAIVNTNVHTYDSAPSLTIIEKIVINNLCKLFYKNKYIKSRGGVFVPGGSYANYLGIRIARDYMFPHCIENGYNYYNGIQPIILTSDQSHYTVDSSSITIGIGRKNIIKIKTNMNATINIDDLNKTLEIIRNSKNNKKYKPFILCSTAGTTIFGAFDNLIELNKICKKYNLWFHVDASWGGSAVFGRDRNEYLKSICNGIEFADSITFSAHKAISVGIQTSVLLVKKEKLLIKSCTPKAKQYLFHENNDKEFNNKKIIDISLKTLQCGRNGDAIRLYLSWLYHGKIGLTKRILNGLNNAKLLRNKLINNKTNNFQLVIDDINYCNVCYWFVPINIKNIFNEWKYRYNYNINYKHYKLIYNILDNLTKLIYKQLKYDGNTYTDFSSLPEKGLPSFIRMITSNYRLNKKAVISVINDVNNAIKSINNAKYILPAKL